MLSQWLKTKNHGFGFGLLGRWAFWGGIKRVWKWPFHPKARLNKKGVTPSRDIWAMRSPVVVRPMEFSFFYFSFLSKKAKYVFVCLIISELMKKYTSFVCLSLFCYHPTPHLSIYSSLLTILSYIKTLKK